MSGNIGDSQWMFVQTKKRGYEARSSTGCFIYIYIILDLLNTWRISCGPHFIDGIIRAQRS